MDIDKQTIDYIWIGNVNNVISNSKNLFILKNKESNKEKKKNNNREPRNR